MHPEENQIGLENFLLDLTYFCPYFDSAQMVIDLLRIL